MFHMFHSVFFHWYTTISPRKKNPGNGHEKKADLKIVSVSAPNPPKFCLGIWLKRVESLSRLFPALLYFEYRLWLKICEQLISEFCAVPNKLYLYLYVSHQCKKIPWTQAVQINNERNTNSIDQWEGTESIKAFTRNCAMPFIFVARSRWDF